jgi:hypothetical protein
MASISNTVHTPAAAAVETVAQREQRENTCPIQGCTVRPTDGMPRDDKRIPNKWAAHQREAHQGNGAAFKTHAAAHNRFWANKLQVCRHAGCGQAFLKGGISNHEKHHCRYRPAVNPQQQGTGTTQARNPAPTLSPDGPRYTWSLAHNEPGRALLDTMQVTTLLKHDLPVSRKLNPDFAPLKTEAFVFVLRGNQTATLQQDTQLQDAWAKLLHLLPTLLLSPDGAISRERRFRHFAAGHLCYLINAALAFAKKRAQAYIRQPRSKDPASVAQTARRSGGLRRAAAILRAASIESPPRNADTFTKLQAKHPAGDGAEELAQAAQDGWTAVHAQTPSLDQFNTIFTEQSISTCIQQADNTTTPGPSGLSVLHLQTMLKYGTQQYVAPFLALLVWLARYLYTEPTAFSPAFRELHVAARMFGVGEKVRPIACGDTLRRLFARLFCWHNKTRIGDLLAPAGQFGSGTASGTDVVATTAQMLHDAGGIVLSTDGTNAFNSLSRSAMYRAVAKHMPSLYAYLLMLYGPDMQPALLFSMDGAELAEHMTSQQGIQQGDGLGPLLWSLCTLDILTSFKQQFPDLPEPSFLDDTFLGSTGTQPAQQEAARLRQGYNYLCDHLGEVKVNLNLSKASCTLPKDPQRAAYVRQYFTSRGVRCVEGSRVVGVPVGPPQYVQQQAAEMLHDAQALRLLRGIVNMGEVDSQVAYAMLRMCYVPKVMHLMRNVPPDLLIPALLRFDAFTITALAAILQEPPALAHTRDAGPNDPASDWDAAASRIMHPDWDGDLPTTFSPQQLQQIHLRHKDGGLGITAMVEHCHAAYLGRSLAALDTALSAMTSTAREALIPAPPAQLPQLSVLTHIRTATDAMLAAGAPADRMQDLVQPEIWDFRQGNTQPLQQALHGHGDNTALREVPVHLQAKLSCLIHAQAKQRFTTSIQPQQGAQGQQLAEQQVTASRWLSQSSKGAMAWCSVIPSIDPAFTLPNALFKETARRALGDERPDPEGRCGNTNCGEIATAAHSRTCMKGAGYIDRHTKCVAATHAGMRVDVGLTGLQLESMTAFLQHTGEQLRTDILIPAGQLNTAPPGELSNEGLGHLVDHVHPDGTAASHRQRASEEAGYAARHAAERKHNKYRGKFATDQYDLIPFAVDQYGAACKEAHGLIQALADKQSRRSGGVWKKGHCVARWRQRVSIALQRAVSESVATAWAKVTQPLVPGGSAPKRWLYKEVHFLAP